MKKALRGLLGWLDRKFPDKVVVTQEQFDKFEVRIKYLEGEVTKFNLTWGFGAGTPPGNGQTMPRAPFAR